MPNPRKNRYLVRNRLHQTVGDFSEEEILSQIRKGKLTGEDEAALFPHLNWKKISSYPLFYDALINLALGVVTFKPSREENSQNELLPPESIPQVPKEGPTHVEGVQGSTAQANSPVGDAQDSTEQLDHPLPEINSNELDDLFSEVNPQQLVERDGPINLEALSMPLNHEIDKQEQAQEPAKKSGFKPGKKRLVLWASVAILLLVLYQSGEDGNLTKQQGSASSIEEARNQKLETSPQDEEDQNIFLRMSAEQAVQMDMPPAYRLAVEYYQKALEINPNAIELYEGLAMAIARALEENPSDSSLQDLFNKMTVRGRAIEPQRTAFYRAEAVAEKAKGNLSEAQKQLDLAIETDSLSPENLLIQSEWMVSDGKYDEAKRVLQSVLAWSRQSIKASYLLALTHYNLQEFDAAWELAQKIIQINPVHAPTYVLIGEIFTKQNDLKSAKAFFLLAAKFSNLAPKKTAGYALWRSGNLSDLGMDKAEARQFYSLSYRFSDEFRPQIQEKLSAQPTAEEITKATDSVLASPAYFERVGQEAAEAKNYERAEGIYLGATLSFPTVGKLWYRLGEARESLARSKEEFRWAAATYVQAIRTTPNEVDAYLKLGLLETAQSNLNKAFEYLQRAEEIAPEDPNVQLSLGKHLFSRKDFRAAIERLRAARGINPTLGEVSYYQGMLYKLFDPSNPKAALRHFEEAYSKDPSNYDALAEWLKLKVVTFEKMFAVKFLRNMLANDPKNAQLLWAFGEVYSVNQEYNRAVQYYQRALDIDKQASKIRLSLAKALASLGKLDEAIAEYKLASDLDAKNGEGYFYASEILYQTKNYAAAKDLLLGLLKVVPSYPGARRLLAMTYQAMNETEPAITEMSKEVKSNPMNFQYQVELSELLMLNKKYGQAIEQLSNIVNLPLEKTVADKRAPSGFRKEPTGLKGYRVRGLLLLAKCHRLLNQVEVSEGAIRSGLALDPENPELRLERGFVFNSLGRYREAAEDFNYFLSKNGNTAEATEVRELLKKIVIEE